MMYIYNSFLFISFFSMYVHSDPCEPPCRPALDFMASCVQDRQESGWLLEFCFSTGIIRYLQNRDGSKMNITNLGILSAIRTDVIQLRTLPLPKLGKTASYLYTNGDVCNETLELRETEVRLKCVKPSRRSWSYWLFGLTDDVSSSITLDLQDTASACKYVLNVNSRIFCDPNFITFLNMYINAYSVADKIQQQKRAELDRTRFKYEPPQYFPWSYKRAADFVEKFILVISLISFAALYGHERYRSRRRM